MAVATKINEIRHGSAFSAESLTEVRFVTAYFGPKGHRTSVGDSAENDDP